WLTPMPRVVGGLEPRLERSIILKTVSVRFGRDEVLRDIDAVFPAKGITAIVGQNGSGKSTLLRVLMGLAPIHAGEVMIDDVALDKVDLRRWRERTAFLPQQPHLPSGKVGDAVRFVAPNADEYRVGRALARLGFGASVVDRTSQELSAGERQRVALARLL